MTQRVVDEVAERLLEAESVAGNGEFRIGGGRLQRASELLGAPREALTHAGEQLAGGGPLHSQSEPPLLAGWPQPQSPPPPPQPGGLVARGWPAPPPPPPPP